jgi:hypothetical protein
LLFEAAVWVRSEVMRGWFGSYDLFPVKVLSVEVICNQLNCAILYKACVR